MGDVVIPDSKTVDRIISEVIGSADIDRISIRECNIMGQRLEQEIEGFQISSLNMGIPGLPTPYLMVHAQQQALSQGVSAAYAPFDGIPRLRKASVAYVKCAYGVDTSVDDHVVTAGAMMGCKLAIRAASLLYGQGKEKVLFLTPTFSVNFRQAEILGVKYERLELKQDNIPLRGDKLVEAVGERVSEGDIAAVMWNSPNNPSWLILDDAEYRGLAAIAEQHDVLLVHDSAYGPMDFRPDAPEVMPTPLSYTDRSILLYSGSKMLSYAGERVGLVVSRLLSQKAAKSGNTLRFELVQNGLYTDIAGCNQSAQHGLSAALEAAVDGSFSIRDHCRPYAERSRRIRQAFLDNGFHLGYAEPDGSLADGFYFSAGKDGFSTGDIVLGLMRSGVSVVPIGIFGVERPYVRVCASLIDSEEKMRLLEERLAHYSRHNPVRQAI
ncbi:pyridoxal phosphate-dependent aminotransferase [Candidatus Woesearchaeota archaeon]|nr:pyridoxal phosphate-dependent aminotransferase [Candidatus Woesearchaeota archaeon]